MFQIGDKVRMLRSSEEGVVVRIKNDIVEIETTDGFELPVMANELTKVSEKEKEYFREHHKQQQEAILDKIVESKTPRVQEIGLAFEQINDFLIRPYFVNRTSTDLLFVLSLKKKEDYVNFASGIAQKDSDHRIYEDLKKEDFGQWSKWRVDIIKYDKDVAATLPSCIEIKLKGANLFKETQKFPFLEKTGYLHLTTLEKPKELLKTNSNTEDQNAFYDTYAFNKTKVLDLHAEALGIVSEPPTVIFEEQKRLFIKELDEAITHNVVELTLIHGVGNGHLKSFIHKQLASNDQVEWFKEAQKEKFGYGATLAHFKA